MKRAFQKIKQAFRKSSSSDNTSATDAGNSAEGNRSPADSSDTESELFVGRPSIKEDHFSDRTTRNEETIAEVREGQGEQVDEPTSSASADPTTIDEPSQPEGPIQETIVPPDDVPAISEEQRKQNKESISSYEFITVTGRRAGRGVPGLIKAVENATTQFVSSDHLNAILSEAADMLKGYQWGNESAQEILSNRDSRERKMVVGVIERATAEVQKTYTTQIGLTADNANFRF